MRASGSGGWAELLPRDTYLSAPGRHCWVAPDSCPLGATIAFWTQYFTSDSCPAALVVSNAYATDENQPIPRAFGVYYFENAGGIDLFAYLGGEMTGGKNYYQHRVAMVTTEGAWHHVTLTFSRANGLRLCVDGTRVRTTLYA